MVFDSQNKKKRQKRAALLLFLFSMGLSTTFLFSGVTPAYAQLTTNEAASVPATVKEVKTTIGDVILQGVIMTIYSAANYFFTTLAYEFATALVECPGQNACWESRFDSALENAADGALGELVMGMGDTAATAGGFEDFTKMTGIDMCAPPDPNAMLNIQIGMMEDVKPPKPRCTWSDLQKNYKKFDLTNPAARDALLDNMKIQFKPGQAPLSMSLSAFDGAAAIKVKAEKDATLKLLMDAGAGGFSAVTDPVSGRVKAPAHAAQSEYDQMVKQRSENPQAFAANVSAGQVAKGAWSSLTANVIQTFVMVLITKMWNKLAQGILSLAEVIQAQPDLVLSEFGVLQSPGGSAIRASFASRQLVPPIRSLSAHDPVALFTACPNRGRSTFNCVMDGGFATAVRLSAAQLMTVQKAIDQGFLDGGKLFIPATEPKNAERFCFEEGYCESNLKKLRAARIIPIGWEIAASKADKDNPPSLQEVIDGFNNCPSQDDPSTQGKEWCHLIDPNWVLKAPPTQCRQMAFGPQLFAPEVDERMEVCIDAPTCLREDGFGNCVGGYAHCTEEKNVWRFYADECPASMNSCRTLTSGNGARINYLLNTIDSGVCNADNAGCAAYATELTMVGAPGGDADDATDDWLFDATRRHLSRQAETCDVTNGGCSELLRFDAGQSLNIIKNGGFEELEDRDKDGTFDSPIGWAWPRGMVPDDRNGHLSATGIDAISGRAAMYLNALPPLDDWAVCSTTNCSDPSGCSCESSGFRCLVPNGENSCVVDSRLIQDNLHIRPNTRYTLSMELRSSEDPAATASLIFYDKFGQVLTASNGPGADIDMIATTSPNAKTVCGADDEGNLSFGLKSGLEDSAKMECQFILTQGEDDDRIAFASLELYGDDTYVDNVQLEEGVGTGFHEGYGAADQAVFAKVPPEYLGCIGDAGDPAECENYAGICRENEIGCLLYTPTSGADPAVPAIAGPTDFCPQECAGFDVFFKQTSIFEPDPDTDNPYYFIPATAAQCPSSYVGCAEFTDIANEQLAFFTELRICQRPADDTAVIFYTWEGSDTAGYQLKTWQLKATQGEMARGDYDVAVSSEVSGTLAGKAPCTVLERNKTTCEDEPILPQEGKCTLSDIELGDYDCREFYDADGNRHYRLMSKVIFITDACSDYRITNATTEGNCNDTNGLWNDTRSECVYKILPQLSRSCPVEARGCREYKGNTASNTTTMFSDSFEEDVEGVSGDWTIGLWRSQSTSSFQSVESLVLGEHSARISEGSDISDISDIVRTMDDMIEAGSQYSLSFWARGTGTLEIRILSDDSDFAAAALVPPDKLCSESSTLGANCGFEDAELRSDWQQYTLGPLTIPSSFPWFFADTAVLRIHNSSGADQYIDNVTLTRVRDNITVVQNSWNTPTSCNRNTFGQDAPLAMLGCREYTNSDGGVSYLKSFTRLCRERSIGCAAYSDLQDTPEETHAQTFNAVCRLDTACSVLNAEGASCICDYEYTHELVPGVPEVVYDACRVSIGASECRFGLDAIDTRTSDMLFPDKVILNGDVRRALVVNEENTCLVTEASCRVMGLPNYLYESTCVMASECVPKVCDGDNAAACTTDSDCLAALGYANECVDSDKGTCTCTDTETGGSCEVTRGALTCVYPREEGYIASWSAVAIKDDPSRYDQTLCLQEAVSCESYVMSGGGEIYFRDPMSHVCEFKGSVIVDGQRRSGWFRKSAAGAFFPCYPEIIRGGFEYEIYKNADPSCTLSTCSLEVECTLTEGCACPPPPAPPAVPPPPTCTVNPGEFSCGTQECTDPNGCVCSVRRTAGATTYTDTEVCKVVEGRSSCGYAGWVGVCQGKWDRCEEFRDPFASSGVQPEGEPYYFLENAKVDYTSCQGTVSLNDSSVSLKEGCVLLKKTSDPRNLYSSGATYRQSENADNASVPPINCETNNPDPLCLKKCYRKLDAECVVLPPFDVTLSSHSSCRNDDDCVIVGEKCIGDDFLGASCTSDAQCNGPLGEICISLQNPPFSLDPFPIKNDANVIVNVTADRECRSWLQCRQAESIFNEDTNEWMTVCSAFGECVEQNQFGTTFECVRWSDPPKKIFSETDYITRDVNWSGVDYSGFSLIDRYPAQYLQPITVTRGACKDVATLAWVMTDGNTCDGVNSLCNEPLKLCISTEHPDPAEECGQDQFCSPPLKGMCIGDTGTPSTACEFSTDCLGNSFCAKTITATQRYGIVRDLCAGYCEFNEAVSCNQDSQCSGLGKCILDFYADDCNDGPSDCGEQPTSCVNECVVDADCPSDGMIAYSDGGNGTCLQNRCWYDFYGGPLKRENRAAAPLCRAAPEKDSPFPFTVLQRGIQGYSNRGTYQGETFKQSFKGANVCTKDNECSCQYVRKTFSGGASERFYSTEQAAHTELEDNSGDPIDTQANVLGVCFDGPFDGRVCDPTMKPTVDEETGESTESATVFRGMCGPPDLGGQCNILKTQTTALGQFGFCVDFDRTLNYAGDVESFVCHQWLPVDRLLGAPNLFNRFKEAGYRPPGGVSELLYCQAAEGNMKGSSYRVLVHDESGMDPKKGGDNWPKFYFRRPNGTDFFTALGWVLFPVGSAINESFGSEQSFEDFFGSEGDSQNMDGRLNFDYYINGWTGKFRKDQIAGIRLEFMDSSNLNLYISPGRWQVAQNFERKKSVSSAFPAESGASLSGGGGQTSNNRIENHCLYLINRWDQSIMDDSCSTRRYGNSGFKVSGNNGEKFNDWKKDGNPKDGLACLGIKAIFTTDSNGDEWLRGFKTAYCNQDGGLLSDDQCLGSGCHREDRVKVYVELREQCTDFGQVYGGSLGGSEFPAVVRTEEMRKVQDVNLFNPAGIAGGIDYEFTSAGLSHPGLINDTSMTPLGIMNPWQAPPEWQAYPGVATDSFMLPIKDQGSSYIGLIAPGTPSSSDKTWRLSGGDRLSGPPYACAGTCPQTGLGLSSPYSDNARDATVAAGADRLQELFAVSWTRFGTRSRNPLYAVVSSGYNWDVRADLTTTANQPQVREYRAGDANCTASNCPEAAIGMTVGGVFGSGNDVCGTGGSLKVEIRYYVQADDDHMPIRRKIFDFGDGSPPVDTQGWFKNHRGVDTDKTSLCSGQEWGKLPQACASQYFEEEKTYLCSQGIIANLLAANITCTSEDSVFPCTDGAACYFRPRVQITDNWGVCNGVCTEGRDDSPVCINTTADQFAIKYDFGDFKEECASELLDIRDNYKATSPAEADEPRPWTEFQGIIKVIPAGSTVSC